jgi:Asp-tRNA(Asn)/Glu-tRNA(Gln) amidotransferase A subunit family amidase
VLDIHRLDATSMADLVRRREASSRELTEAAIARIERFNPRLNAVVTPLFDEALRTADRCDALVRRGAELRPLHGVPVLIKDLFDFRAGVRNTFGSRAFVGFVPSETSAHVARLESAGAVILGKTNTPEFGHKGTTDNELFGPTSNPFDLLRNAGGSSGGSAAAVAAGLVPLAQGSDAGGSIRIPAAWCGVVGFKPSYGRIPLTGGPNAFGTHTPFVHVGPLARTVRDAALMTAAMAGPHPRDPLSIPDDGLAWAASVNAPIRGLRVAFSADFGVFAVDPATVDVARAAAKSLGDAGAHVDEPGFALPCSQQELADLWRREVGVFYAEFFAAMEETGLSMRNEVLPFDVRQMTEYGRSASALAERRDQWLRSTIFHAIQQMFERYDLVVTPTVGCPAVLNQAGGGTLGPSEINGTATERCIGWCLTHPVNFTGHPAASVPAGLTREGLPVGLQIIGQRYDDGRVLAACGALERIRAWMPALEQAWSRLDIAI